MLRRDKMTAAVKDAAQKPAPRPAEPRSWPTANKTLGGGKKAEARRKLPSGPLGGSGRKTNVSRSS